MASFVMVVVALAVDYIPVQELEVRCNQREVFDRDMAFHSHPLSHHLSPVVERNLVNLTILPKILLVTIFVKKSV